MPIKNVNAKTLKQWLENKEAVLIDVRETGEAQAKSIPDANLVPLAKVSKNNLPELANKKLVLHCASGKRSSMACQKLLQEDSGLEIYNLEGGIAAWEKEGCGVKISKKFFLPLDQQVQLTIGVGVLSGSVLGYFVNPLFFLLSGFFGAGLIFAGLSGYCGLAMLMAKMPWNRGCEGKISCVK